MESDRGILEATHRVVTPEYVEFDFVLAGLFGRFLAWLIDSAIVLALAVATLMLLGFASVVVGGFGMAAFFVAYFLINWGYGIALETLWSGQTLGKRALGLRVIQESGVRINFYQAAVRNLLRLVDQPVPGLYAVGAVSALFSDAQQRLGDMAAGTIVVRERRLRIPAAIARAASESQLLADPLFRSRLAKLTPKEQELLFAAAIRREELALEPRLKLFSAISRRLQEDLGVFKPDHLSDEKLVVLAAAAAAKSAPGKAAQK